VCCWIQQNGYAPLIAACDTFRAGAVEQLKVHASRLNVELFERGYRTDPTMIAMDAIRYGMLLCVLKRFLTNLAAKQNNKDVLFIDTAGRMQDNEPLMNALSKLVNTVEPNLVLRIL
jgi:signal recognition particle receptor subunit alpha